MFTSPEEIAGLLGCRWKSGVVLTFANPGSTKILLAANDVLARSFDLHQRLLLPIARTPSATKPASPPAYVCLTSDGQTILFLKSRLMGLSGFQKQYCLPV